MRALLAIAMCLGCSHGCGGEPTTSTEIAETEGTTGRDRPPATETTPPTETVAETPLDPAPPPSLRLITALDGEGATVRVQNHGAAVARLRGRVSVQRQNGDTWEELTGVFGLRPHCQAEVPDCLDLAPGGELLPPAWLGTRGDAQCACNRCAPVDGTVRFVVRSCAPEGHTPHEVASPPFEI